MDGRRAFDTCGQAAVAAATFHATGANKNAALRAEADERLLKLIQAWPRVSPARQRMIEAIIETSE